MPGLGKKKISELYVKSKTEYDFEGIYLNFDTEKITVKRNDIEQNIDIHECIVKEGFDFQTKEETELTSLLQALYKQSNSYKEILTLPQSYYISESELCS